MILYHRSLGFEREQRVLFMGRGLEVHIAVDIGLVVHVEFVSEMRISDSSDRFLRNRLPVPQLIKYLAGASLGNLAFIHFSLIMKKISEIIC